MEKGEAASSFCPFAPVESVSSVRERHCKPEIQVPPSPTVLPARPGCPAPAPIRDRDTGTVCAAQSWEPIISRRRAGRGPEGTGHGSSCDDSECQRRWAPGPNSGYQVTGTVRRRRRPRPVAFLNSKPFSKLLVCRWGSNSGYEHVALNFKLAG